MSVLRTLLFFTVMMLIVPIIAYFLMKSFLFEGLSHLIIFLFINIELLIVNVLNFFSYCESKVTQNGFQH